MEKAARMVLKEEFNLFNAAPTQLGRLAYASAALNINNEWLESNATNPQHKKDKQKEDETEDLAQLALETIRQAYEQFQNQYAETMAFYDDAEERLNRLEARINDRINDLDSKTELLTDQNGMDVYLDQEGNFYRLEQDQQIPITDEDEIESLKTKVQTIEGAGKSVRSEDQQNDYLYLSNLLTDKMNLDADMSARRAEAKDLNAEVEKDHSKAPEATEKMSQSREEIKEKLEKLEREVDDHDFARRQYHEHQLEDEAPETDVIANNRSAFTSTPPDTGFSFS